MPKKGQKQDPEKVEQRALARIVPSQTVNVDGHEIMVPNTACDNAMANKIVVAQMRNMLQTTVKKLKDQDILPTPKELRDLFGAAKDLVEFSGLVYQDKTGEDQLPKAEKAVTQESDEISLDAITQTKKNDEATNGNGGGGMPGDNGTSGEGNSEIRDDGRPESANP